MKYTQSEIDELSLIQRASLPTPKLFRILKTIGLTLVAVSAALLTAPVALPAIITTIAGYLAVAGMLVTAVSQVTVDSDI